MKRAKFFSVSLEFLRMAKRSKKRKGLVMCMPNYRAISIRSSIAKISSLSYALSVM